MKKCKNCNGDIGDKRVFCSNKCSCIYNNKHHIDKKKSGEINHSKFVDKYNLNPNFCKTCGKKIPYNKRRNTYCNSSCSAQNSTKKKIGMTYIMSEEGIKNIQVSAKKKAEKYLKENPKFCIKCNNELTNNERKNKKCKHCIDNTKTNNTNNRIYNKKVITPKNDNSRIAYNKRLKDYYNNPKHCKQCGEILDYSKRKLTYCSKECYKEYFYLLKPKKDRYKHDCRFTFHLSDYPNEFDFTLIENYGWYKPTNKGNNLHGVSRDHMYSVAEGFKNDISPEIVSHPANCKLMIHNENNSKNSVCSITIEQLFEKIEEWNKIYGRVLKR